MPYKRKQKEAELNEQQTKQNKIKKIKNRETIWQYENVEKLVFTVLFFNENLKIYENERKTEYNVCCT